MTLWMTRWMMVLVAALLAACGGGGGGSTSSVSGSSSASLITEPLASGYPGSPVSCTVATQREWLRDYLNDRYYWYDQQRAPNEAAADMNAYLASMRASPDRYSFAALPGSGQPIFFGYTLKQDPPGRLFVQFVEPSGPSEQAGLRRGDEILKINGFSTSLLLGGTVTLPTGSGVTRSFEVSRPDGSTASFTATGRAINPAIVLTDQVVTSGGGRRVGYLVYQAFEGNGSAMQNAIARLKAANVQEFVLDLRYNGGGSTAEAARLATLLAGNARSGAPASPGVFARYSYNDKYSSRNFTQGFNTQLGTQPIEGLPRVFVITSQETASASEMIINGLRPYMTVVTIGNTTFGKPFAFGNIRSACDVEYYVVDLRITNRDGQGGYDNGIAPTCTRPDDLTQQLGSSQEGRLAEALHYIDNGSCRPSASSSSAQRSLTESPLGAASPAPLPVPAHLQEGQRRRGAFVD